MKLDGVMLNKHGGSTDDGVRSDMSSENCRVIRHFFDIRTSENAKRVGFSRPKTRLCFLCGVKTETMVFEFDEKVRFL